ncbi:MAG: hypothetical protein COY66_04045 [Candidatus Kerfeldbacteria bacterium CG_4_10_14_0_8_um_filter_42_10]|uniref:Uncharacterized protein n=1 Tax=Candidatus Kerfeldbacteria bacterium CG_4_10_14_0_8_um_filter_42_10 TaxID=2014248 RepID=A0A2M7RIE7_9BACT|nr:MAG: hypothetical protein COY66_04045 [Candidatus Kerfeldbacteria bacterium CG_4_10_14_0_8_um_filter_42_10]
MLIALDTLLLALLFFPGNMFQGTFPFSADIDISRYPLEKGGEQAIHKGMPLAVSLFVKNATDYI